MDEERIQIIPDIEKEAQSRALKKSGIHSSCHDKMLAGFTSSYNGGSQFEIVVSLGTSKLIRYC